MVERRAGYLLFRKQATITWNRSLWFMIVSMCRKTWKCKHIINIDHAIFKSIIIIIIYVFINKNYNNLDFECSAWCGMHEREAYWTWSASTLTWYSPSPGILTEVSLWRLARTKCWESSNRGLDMLWRLDFSYFDN